MIQIIPCISVYGSKIARFHNNDPEKIVIYDDSPLEMAMRLEDHGIKRVHLLDLEGARAGRVLNTHVLESIAGYTDLEIDYGGGIHDDDDIRVAFEYGADMINAASVAVNNPELFASWIISFGRRKIILSVDVTNEVVHTRGWVKRSETKLMDLLDFYDSHGVMYVKCSDISHDGGMYGPDFTLYKKILNRYPHLRLIASGGIGSVTDIERLADLGVHGVIFARAFYENKIDLKDLIKFLC
jgi:phosphoribosylformimino-5-aminoimidazole carboxamide ribotide isomerase